MKTKKIVVGLFCSMIILMGCQPDQRTEKMKESTEAEAVQVTSGASAATNATSVKQEEQTNTNDQPKESAAKVSYERNGHTFEVDAVSGATVEANNQELVQKKKLRRCIGQVVQKSGKFKGIIIIMKSCLMAAIRL